MTIKLLAVSYISISLTILLACGISTAEIGVGMMIIKSAFIVPMSLCTAYFMYLTMRSFIFAMDSHAKN